MFGFGASRLAPSLPFRVPRLDGGRIGACPNSENGVVRLVMALDRFGKMRAQDRPGQAARRGSHGGKARQVTVWMP